MKNLIFVFCLILLLSTGCAKKVLILHGSVYPGSYRSEMAGFNVESPPNWYATTTSPNSTIEYNIRQKIVRQRELGYLIKNDQTALIAVETYPFTWAGQKKLPSDFTREKGGSEILADTCERFIGKRGDSYTDKPVRFSYKCNMINYGYWCSIKDPCLESEMKISPESSGGRVVIERVYIIGPEMKEVVENHWDSKLHGWRVVFILESPQSDYKENLKAFKSVIASIERLYQ